MSRFCASCGTTRPLHPCPECAEFIERIPRNRIAITVRHIEEAVHELRALVAESSGLAQADANYYAEHLERVAKQVAFDAEVAASIGKVAPRE